MYERVVHSSRSRRVRNRSSESTDESLMPANKSITSTQSEFANKVKFGRTSAAVRLVT